MGERRIRCGPVAGRLAALGVAFACTLLGTQSILAQTRAPARDSAAARSLAGKVVQYEETNGSAILYHDEKGGLMTNVVPSPAQLGDGTSAAKPRPVPAPNAAPPKAAPATAVTNAPTPARATTRKAAPAEGVALRP